MASFTTSNVSANNLVGRELSIASSFVRQYYTLLNKAPCFIHNFYSHDSTFIHGTIEMANEHPTEPVVGREKIKGKMEDLKLNDCRAKIKQIDCLETLAGGLVIQVIGELSENGKPMRRFLQTFVLAPSPDESRQEGDQHARSSSERTGGRGANPSETSSSVQNQKFFVLNSIFRYQDDGPENDFEDDVSSSHAANLSTETPNGGGSSPTIAAASSVSEQHPINTKHQMDGGGYIKQQQQLHNNLHIGHSNGSIYSDYSQNNRKRPLETVVRRVESVEKLANDLDDNVKLNKSNLESGSNGGEIMKREPASGLKVVSNGTGNILDKNNDVSEKSTENGKTAATEHLPASTLSSSDSASQLVSSTTTALAASKPAPSNEPKTWANMVRNAHPPSTQSVQANVIKPVPSEQQPQQQQQPQQHHQQQQQLLQQPQQHNTNQIPIIQAQQQRRQQQQQPQQSPLQSPYQQQPTPQQQQPQQLHQQSQDLQMINVNNRRRNHMMRKPPNKINGGNVGVEGLNGGRSLKQTRPSRPPGAPVAMTSQPQQLQHAQQQQQQTQQTPAPPAAGKPMA